MKKQLILLHGALGCQSDFNSIAPLLSEDFEVYRFNFSGHGHEPFSSEVFGIETFAKELEEFIDQQKLHKPLIFGYSMGGYVALHLATINKQIFSKVITLGTKFEWTPESAYQETSRMNPEVMAEKIPAYTDALLAAHGLAWKTLVEQTAGMMIELGESPLLTEDTLPTIEIPVEVLLGEDDHMVSEDESLLVVSLMDNASFTKLPATKHPIGVVDQNALTSVIKTKL